MTDLSSECSEKHLSFWKGRPRQGSMLIEVVLSFSLISTVLAGTVTLMALTRKSDLGANRSLLVRQEIRRFADDVRRDVLLCSNMSTQNHALILTNESTGGRTFYTMDAVKQSITRTGIDADEKTVFSDTYQIDAAATVEKQTDASFESVTWSIDLRGGAKDAIVISVKRRSP